MALRSCYECNKEISTKAIMCPQCGAPQNPVSGLVDKTLNVFKKFKNDRDRKKEIERQEEKQSWLDATPEQRKIIKKCMREEDAKSLLGDAKDWLDGASLSEEMIQNLINSGRHKNMTEEEKCFYKILEFEDINDFDICEYISDPKSQFGDNLELHEKQKIQLKNLENHYERIDLTQEYKEGLWTDEEYQHKINNLGKKERKIDDKWDF